MCVCHVFSDSSCSHTRLDQTMDPGATLSLVERRYILSLTCGYLFSWAWYNVFSDHSSSHMTIATALYQDSLGLSKSTYHYVCFFCVFSDLSRRQTRPDDGQSTQLGVMPSTHTTVRRDVTSVKEFDFFNFDILCCCQKPGTPQPAGQGMLMDSPHTFTHSPINLFFPH